MNEELLTEDDIRVLSEKLATKGVEVTLKLLMATMLKRTFDEYKELKKAHKELLDRAHVYGIWGPWSEGWEGSYDQKHWGEE